MIDQQIMVPVYLLLLSLAVPTVLLNILSQLFPLNRVPPIEIDPQKLAEVEEANKITKDIEVIQRQLKTADSEQTALLIVEWRRLLDKYNTIVDGWKQEKKH